MLCKYPTVFNKHIGVPSPCGQCTPCRVNQRSIWAHRFTLESQEHDDCSFLTLTYNDDNLPGEYVHPKTGEIFAPLSVNPGHHKQFINTLQTYASRKLKRQIRYFGVGEYGEKTNRPHYHLALFGYPSCPYRGASIIGQKFRPCLCPTCKFISDIWGKGNIFLGSLTLESANYIAGYVNKKLTNNSDYRQDGYTGLTNAQKLQGRYPEFSRPSRNPGIGSHSVDRIASLLTTYGLSDQDNIPRVLAHGTKLLPLGRYLTDKLYDKLDITFAPGERAKRFERSLRAMLNHPKDSTLEIAKASQSSLAVALQWLNAQPVLNLEKRLAHYKKGSTL